MLRVRDFDVIGRYRRDLGAVFPAAALNVATGDGRGDRILGRDRLVCRRVNPDDGRGVLAAITPSGRDRALEASSALNGSLFSGVDLSPSDTDTLFRLLGKLRRRAGDFD